MKRIMQFLKNEINKLKDSNLFRTLKIIENTDGRTITINGKEYLNFCSNNYLGLANHPEVIKKATEALKKYGAGSGASRLISGTLKIHEELEKKLAEFKHCEAAIVFPTGYMANLGVISSLLGENDTVIIDRLNHASIIDACNLSNAKLQVYKHCDMESLEKVLQRSQNFGKRLIVTDYVFSMDGDIAPVDEILELGKKYDAIIMIDEAHATGIIEPGHGLASRVDIRMGTLSKALGSLGGFVCGSKDLIDFLRNKARSFIYTTALPPANCAAALASLELIEKQPEIQKRLQENIRYFYRKILEPEAKSLGSSFKKAMEPRLSVAGSALIPIIPIIIGDTEKTLKASQYLFDNGIFVTAIRPPTVPKGKSRLRITLSALHKKEDIDQLTSSLQNC